MAATTHRWTGSVDGDWENVGNWDTAALPGSGGAGLDTAIVPKDIAQALTTNLDRQGDDGAQGLHLALLHVEEGAPAIGASGSELKLTADKITLRGDLDGSFYFENATGAAGNATSRMIIDSLSNDIVITGDGTASFEQMEIVRGGVTLAVQDGTTGYAINRLYIAYASNPLFDVNVNITTVTDELTFMHIGGGTVVTNASENDHVVVSAGDVTFGESADWKVGTNELAQTGGLITYNIPTGGTDLLTAILQGGTFDTTQTSGEKSIALMNVFPGAVLIDDDDLVTWIKRFVGVP